MDKLHEPLRFTTPVLRRRRSSVETGATRSSTGSDAGLGGMHFIRSVVNHMNEGGECDAVESEYIRLEEEQGRREEKGDGDGGQGVELFSEEEDNLSSGDEAFTVTSKHKEVVKQRKKEKEKSKKSKKRKKEEIDEDSEEEDRFEPPKKGEIVVVKFGPKNYECTVDSDGVVKDRKGRRCVKVAGKGGGGKEEWTEFIPLCDWEDRLVEDAGKYKLNLSGSIMQEVDVGGGGARRNSVSAARRLSSSGGLARPPSWGGVENRNPVGVGGGGMASNPYAPKSSGGGGGMASNPYAPKPSGGGGGGAAKPAMTDAQRKRMEENKAKAARVREERKKAAASGNG